MFVIQLMRSCRSLLLVRICCLIRDERCRAR
jgi:hypothetical protein